MLRRHRWWVIPVAAAVGLVWTGSAGADTVAFQDQFSDQQPVGPWGIGPQYVNTDGKWTLQFDGYGHVGEEADTVVMTPSLALQPAPPVNALDGVVPEGVFTAEHAALVTSHPSFADSTLSLSMRTIAQLRQTAQQNPWEVGWVLWHLQDQAHFYYLILKPNGWELGKETPDPIPGVRCGYGQCFLASGNGPTYPVGGPWNSVQIGQRTTATGAEEIVVTVNGQQLADYTDGYQPYTSGQVGLYDEDSYAHFANVVVTTPSTP